MSMEEVAVREDEVIRLRYALQQIRDFVTLEPLDLLRLHEIQSGILAIIEKAEND